MTAHRFYAFYLACMGRHEEALAFAEHARRVDPVWPLAQMNVATIHYFARRYDEAIAEIGDTLDLAPDFGPARILLGRVYVAKGMFTISLPFPPGRCSRGSQRSVSMLG